MLSPKTEEAHTSFSWVGALTNQLYVVFTRHYVLRYADTDLVVFKKTPRVNPCTQEVNDRLDVPGAFTEHDLDALRALPHWQHEADEAMAPLHELATSLGSAWSFVEHLRRHTTCAQSDETLERWLYNAVARLIEDER